MLNSYSEAVTHGVHVRVESRYVKDQSKPSAGIYVFSYKITITNQSDQVVHLQSRHWIITDAKHHIEEVHGAGVVGETPVLEPEETFSYESGCMLKTPYGTMQGSYQMITPDGDPFDVEIAPFLLCVPYSIN